MTFSDLLLQQTVNGLSLGAMYVLYAGAATASPVAKGAARAIGLNMALLQSR